MAYAALIEGTNGDDTLVGTRESDVIVGKAGDTGCAFSRDRRMPITNRYSERQPDWPTQLVGTRRATFRNA